MKNTGGSNKTEKMADEEDYTGIYVLFGLLLFFLLIACLHTGFNPFTDCSQLNSTSIRDCWFK